MTVIYSARWVLPIISAAIENGAVAVDESIIAGVGSRAEIVSPLDSVSFCRSALVETSVTLA